MHTALLSCIPEQYSIALASCVHVLQPPLQFRHCPCGSMSTTIFSPTSTLSQSHLFHLLPSLNCFIFFKLGVPTALLLMQICHRCKNQPAPHQQLWLLHPGECASAGSSVQRYRFWNQNYLPYFRLLHRPKIVFS
jgi:hypothetical protein